jgi:glycine hydroxymethyltransferase
MITSRRRIGTPALAARGFDADDFAAVADLIARALVAADGADTSSLAAEVRGLAEKHPLYPEM